MVSLNEAGEVPEHQDTRKNFPELLVIASPDPLNEE